jgi:hypothetical protein
LAEFAPSPGNSVGRVFSVGVLVPGAAGMMIVCGDGVTGAATIEGVFGKLQPE